MLVPGISLDSSGRVRVVIASGGAAPARISQGVALDADGRVLCDSDATNGDLLRIGISLNPANSNLFVAQNVAGTDVFTNGYRLSFGGSLVVEVEGTPEIFAQGQGFLANGALCVTEL